jgi:hypothetical protein
MVVTAGRVIRLRLICEAPPTAPGLEFGLQDSSGAVEPGVPEPDGSLRFDAELRAVTTADGDTRLRGPIVHGPTGARFLYLSCRSRATPNAPWIFRLKVPLKDLDPAEAAVQARVRTSGGGTVPLLGRGWTRLDSE